MFLNFWALLICNPLFHQVWCRDGFCVMISWDISGGILIANGKWFALFAQGLLMLFLLVDM
jgi:hypothetical protein